VLYYVLSCQAADVLYLINIIRVLQTCEEDLQLSVSILKLFVVC